VFVFGVRQLAAAFGPEACDHATYLCSSLVPFIGLSVLSVILSEAKNLICGSFLFRRIH
jgi:hypothetical protein